MKSEIIKKYGLRYLGIRGAMSVFGHTFYSNDIWYSRKLHGLVGRFDTYHGEYIVYKNPEDSKCWLALAYNSITSEMM